MIKKLRWAVVGPPSSGKTYLLSDLIKTFGAMGYERKKLPVTSPYSSFGTFFYESGNIDGGGLAQTQAFAGREGNHYHAMLQPHRGGTSIELDFLNIPGETFDDIKKNTLYFLQLTNKIGKLPKGYFQLTTYYHPSGNQRLILEPNGTTRLEEEDTPRKRNIAGIMYQNLNMVYNNLKQENFHRGKSRKISGKYLLREFFTIVPDSIFATFKLTWKTAFHEFSLTDYEEMLDYKFYFLLYCQKATDIIICERLYKPRTKGEIASGSNAVEVIKMMTGFISNSGAKPHVFMAFRGADFILGPNENLMKEIAVDAKNVQETRYLTYEYFCQRLLQEQFEYAGCPAVKAIDPNGDFTWKVTNGHIPGGCTLSEYIRRVIGDDIGQGFWYILSVSKSMHSNRFTRMMPSHTSTRKIYGSRRRPWIPPHVYFTATPVDTQLNVYENDRRDQSRFIYEDCDGKIKSFHIETESKRTDSLLFGTYQLLTDLLMQHGIRVKGSHAKDGMIGYFNEKNIKSFL